MPAIIKIKRGQKRNKGARKRGVAKMLGTPEGQNLQTPTLLPPSVRVVTPRVVISARVSSGISYQEARSKVLEYLCPDCEGFLTESSFCPKCGRSWGLDDLEVA